ncbi:MAG TPA: hypothetical protein VGO58_09375 [Chitinophagaceae bacterium]|jgi:hypothetical protein|nr:hypothetical protein [Chitinophagaceae bacterium]
MKKIILLISFAAVASFASAQNNGHIVSFDGMDELKIGIGKVELEKLLKIKIEFKHIGKDERYTETINATYKGIPMEIDMMRSDEIVARLDGMRTSSPLFKTAEGIGVGSDQQTIINTYEKHLLIIDKETITLADADNLHSSIVFWMKDKKVVAIGSEPTAAFRDRE